jgi:hypothetical protein
MPTIDFTEIPRANISSGEQDSFELFARDVLESLGYKVISGPDRGSDGGKDILVLETRTGVGGETHIPWLVSCKHTAHSGNSVGVSDEQDIIDRVNAHQCAGFIGFYSTLPSSSLTRKLEGLKTSDSSFEFQVFDKERIERFLLYSGIGQHIAERFFPVSYQAWRKENFGIALAMARVGMPQPIAYKFSGDDKTFTLEEVLKMYPQGNQYLFDPFMPVGFIFCNNILGITKLFRGDEMVDPPRDYFVQRDKSIEREIAALRQERTQQTKEPQNSNRPKKRNAAKKKMVLRSKRRNRKK